MAGVSVAYWGECTDAITSVPDASDGQQAAKPWPTPVEPKPMQPVSDPAISDILVTNHRDVAFSVTWRTDRPSTGWVEYGDTPDLGQVAYDEQGEGTVSWVHHVTLTSLTPEETYTFRVHSGNNLDYSGGALYQVTTLATTLPPVPYLAYGVVETASGEPAVGALVRVWLLDDEGAKSQPLSTLVDGYGYWTLNLPLAACGEVTLQLQAIGPKGSVAELAHPACDVQPAPALALQEESSIDVYLPLVMR
jgi:hypothetical protein